VKKFLIRGGKVFQSAGFETRDVLISDGKIARIGTDLRAADDCGRVDAAGCYVLPGLVDFHVHIGDRIGEFALADSYESGSQAAILAGVTTLISFVTQANGRTLTECLDEARAKVNGKSLCDVAFHLTPTRFSESDWSEIEALASSGQRTFKFYTTYREAGLYQDWDSLRKIFARLAKLKVGILIHAEDQETLDRCAMESGKSEPFSHTRARPPEAEITAIRRLVDLARETGAKIHVVHVSTAEGARLISEARKEIEITYETAPQYLLLNDEKLRGGSGHRYLCTPPLRREENRAALEGLAREGAFDVFATDHAAFTREDKDRYPLDYRRAPNGVAGVGAMFPLLYERLVVQNKMPLHDLVKRLSENSARLAGLFPKKGTLLEGADADMVIVNTNGQQRAVRSSLADCYETYEGVETTLDFRFVLLRGEIVVKNNHIMNETRATGQALRATA